MPYAPTIPERGLESALKGEDEASARGLAPPGRGVDAGAPPEATPSPAPEGFDFAGTDPGAFALEVDFAAEASSHPPGAAVKTERVLLGEMMARIMNAWMKTNNLNYPTLAKKESGIGPASRVGETSTRIGGKSYPASMFRSCSPTTFRAFMEALQSIIPPSRNMETDKTVDLLYKKWQCADGVYPGKPMADRKGAIDVIVETALGQEMEFAGQIRQATDLRPGDILQTWTRKRVQKKDDKGKPIKEKGKPVYDPDKEAWGGHSSIVTTSTDGVKTISATTPEGSPAIKVRPGAEFVKLLSRLSRGDAPPEWGLQRVYVARTTHFVTLLT
jgi:hypothetical protein